MFYIFHLIYCAIRKLPTYHKVYHIKGHTIHVYANSTEQHLYHRTSHRTLSISVSGTAVEGCVGTVCRYCPANYYNLSHKDQSRVSMGCRNTLVYQLTRPLYKKEPRC